MECAETQVRRGWEEEKINEMQFESRGFAPRSIATERNRKEKRTGKDGNVSRDQSRYYDGAAREMSSPFAQEIRTKESILSSLSRNDPIQPLDFTLRSRYETISISFAKGPSGTEDFFDISRGFGILYGPLYLAPLVLFLVAFSFPFHASPDAYRSNRVARNWRACCSITRTFAVRTDRPKSANIQIVLLLPYFTSFMFPI